MRILVIDNYDSFVFNLVHYMEELDCEVVVKRNDKFSLNEVDKFDKIVLSPGPGLPSEAGKLKELIVQYAKKKPILGVCLGLQAIGEVFGASLEHLDEVYHGVATKATILVDDEVLFKNLETEIVIGRYHSWVLSSANFPEELEVTSVDRNNQIMSLRHKIYDVRGVQFHPESILTENGKQLIQNWIDS